MGVGTIGVVSRKKLGAQTGPMMLMMLAIGQDAWAVSCLQIPVLVGSALYDKHETGLVCIAQAKPYKMCTLHGF